MLLLEKITLKNACQHADLVIILPQGLSAIVGPNGAGKSSILRLVAYGLTGLIDGTWGTQSNLQKDGQLTAGYVQLQLSQGQHVYKIRRYFIDNAKLPDTVHVNGQLKVTKRSAVDAYLQQLTGINKTVLFQLVWAKQEALDWLLTATAANIDQFLSQVFNLSKLKALRAVLQQVQGYIYDMPVKTTPQVLQAKQQHIQQLEALCQQQQQQMDTMRSMKQQQQKQYQALSKMLMGKLSPEQYSRSVSSARQALQRLVQRQQSLYNASTATLQLSQAQLQEARQAQHTAQLLLRRISSWGNRQLLLQRAQAKRAIKLQQLQFRKAQQDKATRRVQQILVQTSICRYCGHLIQDEAAYITAQLQSQFGYDSSVQSVQTFLQSMNDSMQLVTQAYNQQTCWVQKAASVKSHIRDRIAAVQSTLAQLQPLLVKLQQYSNSCAALAGAKQLQGAIDQATSRVQQASNRPVRTVQQQQQLQQLHSEMQQLQTGIVELAQQLQANKASKDAQSCQLQRQLSQLTQSTINSAAKQVLAEIRSCFGAQRAQAKFVTCKIQALNHLLQQYCTRSDLPFVLYLDPQQHVFKYTQDEFIHPAGHLSGAQKKIAAMILQICLLAIVQPNIGLQMLDEVDASLDPANRIMLSQMIARLAGTLRGSMLLVTRQEQTISQCSNTIQLQ